MNTKSKDKNISVYYDGDCPFCSSYIQLQSLREEFNVTLINLRDVPLIVSEFRERGYEVNDGMIVELGDSIYYGADAIWMLSTISNNKGILRRIFIGALSLRFISRFCYPAFKFIRSVTLLLLGKNRLQ